MKKATALILAFIFSFALFSGCASKETENGQKLKIVAASFPEYDWLKEIMGEKFSEADVSFLCKNGTDLHSYQPTAEDIIKISVCDIFICSGGQSSAWTDGALKNAENKETAVIKLTEVLGDGVKTEETVEGMEEEKHGEEETEIDEHVWLSIKNAEKLCEKIEETLSEKDPSNADIYKKNTDEYIKKLDALDKEYEKTVFEAKRKTLLFADRFPFRYLTDDYGLTYYAAFAGCSAESEASFETVSFLAKKTDELFLPAVITIDGSDKKLAETVISATDSKNAEILTMDSMQAKTEEDVKNGISYLSVMEKNLEILKQALN